VSAVVNPPTVQFRCRNPRRAEAVRESTTLNGIDFLEVSDDQTALDVHVLRDLAASPALNAANVRVEGGVRATGITVLTATPTAADVLTVTVDRPGDFSPYVLRLVDPVSPDQPAAGYDKRLSDVTFSFKAGCPSDLDCAAVVSCPPVLADEPALDYLAKDYASFRGLMLDRLATTLPGWTERNAADQQLMLVELLAYVADRLSYFQDAVATEAYLTTARRRVSVRRHARLLDYRMHDGCSARTFVHFTASTGLTLHAGRAVQAGPDEDAVVFQLLHEVELRAANNGIPLYTWGDDLCCLPAGATRATLDATDGPELAVGDFLLFEESTGPTTGDPADADPTHRQVVRLTDVTPDNDPLTSTSLLEVAWSSRDALAFPLCVTNIATVDGVHQHVVCGVARGNVALADQGLSGQATLPLADDPTDAPGRWRPRLPEGPVTQVVDYDQHAPAAALLAMDPRTAHPVVTLDDGELEWTPDPAGDLVDAAATAPVFVLEIEDGGETRIRFGDGVSGMEPARGAELTATYRTGNGTPGNIPGEALDRLREAESGVDQVRNPLPAQGGVDPEPMEQVRRLAPQAYRVQERAVTAADYSTVTAEVPGVQRAATNLRWTGSWYTAAITVDQIGGGALAPDLVASVSDVIQTQRMAGVDFELNQPVPLPLELALDICVRPGYFATQVESQVLDVLSSRVLPDGRRGFFHPDNFTFGQPLYLSQVYAAVLTVPGVAQVNATALHRFGKTPGHELADGVLVPHGLEIIQLADDPNFPERGRLTLNVVGGL
jgi:hypothetical protein